MISHDVYELDDGSFAYRIYENGEPRRNQKFAPGLPGFVPMTAEQAQGFALADHAEYEAAVAAALEAQE